MGILCLESGGTKLVAAWAGEGEELLRTARRYRRPEQRAPETLEQLVALGREIQNPGGRLEAVCLGFGGPVQRPEMHPQVCYHEEGWQQIDARGRLESAFSVPVFIENDCKLAALAEAHRGAGSTAGTLFYMTVGTGIGGAVVCRGELLELGSLGEGEIGHLVVEEEGPRCGCGNRGCLETLCSGPGLALLSERVTGSRLEPLPLMERFRAGDGEARRVVKRAAGYLASALACTINLLNPQQIVLGGGVMKGNREFLEAIAGRVSDRVFPPFRGRTDFLLSRLEEMAVCQGAAIYARRRVTE